MPSEIPRQHYYVLTSLLRLAAHPPIRKQGSLALAFPPRTPPDRSAVSKAALPQLSLRSTDSRSVAPTPPDALRTTPHGRRHASRSPASRNRHRVSAPHPANTRLFRTFLGALQNQHQTNDNHEHDQRPMHRMWRLLHRPPLRWLLRMPQLPTHQLRRRLLPLLSLGGMGGDRVGKSRSANAQYPLIVRGAKQQSEPSRILQFYSTQIQPGIFLVYTWHFTSMCTRLKYERTP